MGGHKAMSRLNIKYQTDVRYVERIFVMETASHLLFSSAPPQIVRTFSFKGMTHKLFGQEAPEQREARLKLVEELIADGEETVKEKTTECE